MFPQIEYPHEIGNLLLRRAHLASIATLISLIGELPEDLILISGEVHIGFVAGVSALRAAVQAWQAGVDFPIAQISGFNSPHVLVLIREALAACPDEFPQKGTAELLFILDAELRSSLRQDLSDTNRALADGEWKAATVLAGSVVEALLLWALQQRSAGEVREKAIALHPGTLEKKPPTDLERWHLPELVEVAAALGLIETDTTAQVRLAKDYRNLIHPGRAIRLQKQCNRGTALGAVAAVEMVVRDLGEQ
jgi:hypothetical protein